MTITIYEIDPENDASEIVLRIPHGIHTLEESREALTRYLMMGLTALDSANVGIFLPSAEDALPADFTRGRAVPRVYRVSLSNSNVWSSFQYDHHNISVTNLIERLEGYDVLDITYTVGGRCFRAAIPTTEIDQNSISITMTFEDGRPVPNPDTKWGRWFREVTD